MIDKTPAGATMPMNPFALIGVLVRVIQRLLRPVRSAAGVGIGAARDLTRTRPGLLAENALLRQRVIVLRRSIRRPRVYDDDRLRLLILARLCRRWRDALPSSVRRRCYAGTGICSSSSGGVGPDPNPRWASSRLPTGGLGDPHTMQMDEWVTQAARTGPVPAEVFAGPS